MKKLPVALALAFCCTSGTTSAAEAVDADRVVAAITASIRAHYVEPAVAETIAEQLRTTPFDARNPQVLAGQLTQLLQRYDRHFSVSYRADDGAPDGAETEPGASWDRAAAARQRNYGFHRVEVLRGNVGYLDLRMFADAQAAGATAHGAMAMLANVDALMIDVRRNGGGAPGMVQLLCSYLLPPEVHLNSLYWRPTEESNQFWTLPWLPGPRLLDVPVFVLTGPRTGSAAEEFAYNLRTRERATLVGGTTAGAANPGDVVSPLPGWQLFVSTGKAVNPVTGDNWEGVGVQPHEAVDPAQAFEHAYNLALASIETRDEQHGQELVWARAFAASEAATASGYGGYLGTFGDRQILVADGKLFYQRGARAPVALRGPVAGYFYLNGSDSMRLRFATDPSGRVQALEELFLDGFSRRFDLQPERQPGEVTR